MFSSFSIHLPELPGVSAGAAALNLSFSLASRLWRWLRDVIICAVKLSSSWKYQSVGAILKKKKERYRKNPVQLRLRLGPSTKHLLSCTEL